MKISKLWTAQRAFTLIELLVVVLIIGILIAIAAPSFLGQQDKAYNSTTKQNLTVVRKELKAIYTADGGQVAHPPLGSYTEVGSLLYQLKAGEPQLSFVSGEVTPTPSTPSGNLASTQQISVTRESDSRVTACQQSKSGTVFCLSADEVSGLNELTASTRSLFGAENAYAAGRTDVVYTTGTGTTLASAEAAARCVAQQAIPGSTIECPDNGHIGWEAASGEESPAPVVVAPVNTVAPSITGIAAVGQQLIASPGTWTNANTFTYSWMRFNGTSFDAIEGATSNYYTPVAADGGKVLKVVVTASGYSPTVSAESMLTASVVNVPVNNSLPTITGEAVVGRELTADKGNWNYVSSATYAYQWYRGSTLIANADTAHYTPATADIGQTLNVRVTATQDGFSTSAQSTETAAVLTAPENVTAPYITGTANSEGTLTGHYGEWTGDGTITYSYTWLLCGVDGAPCQTSGYTGLSIPLTVGWINQSARLRVTATVNGVSTTVTSDFVNVVAATPASPVNNSLPTISGTATVGATLTATTGDWSNQPSYAYQWQACDNSCTDIAGATASTFTLTAAQSGKQIRVVITATNGGGQTSAASAQTSAVNITASTTNRLGDGTASTNVTWYSNLNAALFNDNNDTTEFVKNGPMSVGDTMSIAFPNQKAVSRVRYSHSAVNGVPCLSNSASTSGALNGTAVFEISDNGTSWTTVTDFTPPSCTNTGAASQDVVFSSAHLAHYVRLRVITARATYWLGLQTFDVYGATM
jgi:prepilin-type N-terminal cleavage/methylation domain-containing protein